MGGIIASRVSREDARACVAGRWPVGAVYRVGSVVVMIGCVMLAGTVCVTVGCEVLAGMCTVGTLTGTVGVMVGEEVVAVGSVGVMVK